MVVCRCSVGSLSSSASCGSALPSSAASAANQFVDAHRETLLRFGVVCDWWRSGGSSGVDCSTMVVSAAQQLLAHAVGVLVLFGVDQEEFVPLSPFFRRFCCLVIWDVWWVGEVLCFSREFQVLVVGHDQSQVAIEASSQLRGDGASIGIEFPAKEPHCLSCRFQEAVKLGEGLKGDLENWEC
jgi:hypothetical protein